MKWVKRGLLIAVAAGILFAIAYGFMPKPVPSELAAATRGDIRVSIDEEGFTRVRDRYTISAPVTGTLSRVLLKPGDTVEAGTLIATVAPTEPIQLDARALAQAKANVAAAKAAILQADEQQKRVEAEWKQAEHERNRLRSIQGKEKKPGDLISPNVVDAAVNAEAAASAALKSAEHGQTVAAAQLELANAALIVHNEGAELTPLGLKAPVAGQILRVYRESAGPVQMGEMLIEIGDPQSLEVVVDLLSSDAVRVKAGMKVRLERWGGEEALHGSVRRVEPSGFTKISSLGVEEQRVNVIVDFTGEPETWAKLGDQYRVEAQVITSEREKVIKIPAGALFNTPEGTSVFVVRDGKAELRVVNVGERNGLEAEILNQLNDGDDVVVHPSDEIKDGTPVISR